MKSHHRIQIILLPLPKFYQSFIATHNRNLQTPITRRNHRKIQIPRASPEAAVEQKTIQQMERPPDEPTESGKPRATDEKRLARIPTTKESWNAQQKKFPDSDGCGIFTKKRENDKQKNNNENYKKIKIKKITWTF